MTIYKKFAMMLAAFAIIFCAWVLVQPEPEFTATRRQCYVPQERMAEVLANAPEGIFSINEEYEKLLAEDTIAEMVIREDVIRQDIITETIISEDVIDEHLQADPYKGISLTEAEFEEFCRMVEAEVTGDKPSDFPVSCTETHIWWAKLRCARVILNRIADDEFPDSMHEVLYQKGQFAPISDKRYYTVEVTDMTRDVCRAALNANQHDDVPDALYFRMGKWHGNTARRGFIKTDKLGISYYSQI